MSSKSSKERKINQPTCGDKINEWRAEMILNTLYHTVSPDLHMPHNFFVLWKEENKIRWKPIQLPEICLVLLFSIMTYMFINVSFYFIIIIAFLIQAGKNKMRSDISED